jgi:hypothetical protein
MYWVELQNSKISGRGISPALTKEQIEVTKKIYDQLTRLPADFETDAEGNIISVVPAPEPEPIPQPPTEQERLQALEDAILYLTLGGI